MPKVYYKVKLKKSEGCVDCTKKCQYNAPTIAETEERVVKKPFDCNSIYDFVHHLAQKQKGGSNAGMPLLQEAAKA